jgi:endoglucanase
MRFDKVLFQVAFLSLFTSSCLAAAAAVTDWPAWTAFSRRFIQSDGRVVDLTFDRKSTSEGQAYAMFMALVANQPEQFAVLLKWTSDNLAAGQLGERLPAWLWGLGADGKWGVKDANSASDADLWIAYSLFEAARLWHAPHYAQTARQLLARISRREVARAGLSGTILLPGAVGFVLDQGRYRINPSYMPGFLFSELSEEDPQGAWQSIWRSYLRLAPQIFSAGIAPDNVVVDSNGKVSADSEREPSASYDGIRVYLWAGMSGPASADLVERLKPYAELTRELGVPPEKVNPLTAAAVKSEYSPIGFSGALLPYLSAIGDKPTLARQLDRIRSAAAKAQQADSTNYYDQILILFGTGWLEGRYRFDEKGRLHPQWQP